MSANLQELFDRIVNHLAKQKFQSKEDHMCKYRSTSGLSCAIGCLIPDDKYKPEFDSGKASIMKVLKESGIMDGYTGEDFAPTSNFLATMQMTHDRFITDSDSEANVIDLKKHLRIVAKQFNLDSHDVDNITSWLPAPIAK